MGSRPERGAYGNARGIPDKQARRARNRENDPRHIAAREEVERNNAELARLEAQAAERAASLPAPPRVMSTIRERMQDTQRASLEEVGATPTPSSKAPQTVTPGRFVNCHCTHTHGEHNGEAGSCIACPCRQYRPKTAPDPLAKPVVIETIEMGDLVADGKVSHVKATVKLATKIEELLGQLQYNLHQEEEEKLARQAEERRTRAARERIAAAEAELAEAQAVLADLKNSPALKNEKQIRAPYSGPMLECPECGRDDIKNPQGLGAHRRKAHGVIGAKSAGK